MEEWIISNQELIVGFVYYCAIFMLFESCRLIVTLCSLLEFYQHPERNSVMVILVPVVLVLVTYAICRLEAISI